MAHMDPLPEEELTGFRDVFAAMGQLMGFVPNSLKTMARRPGLVKAFGQLALETGQVGDVDPALKQLVGLVASTAAGCMYCQAHLTTTSKRAEVSTEKIAAAWEFEASPLFSDAERAALRFAKHAALLPNAATAEDFAELRKHYSESEIVEILATVCLFRWLNCWNDTMATTLEELPGSDARAHLSSTPWEPGKHGESRP
jgi:uncharacterized peroxidase-related enzyme